MNLAISPQCNDEHVAALSELNGSNSRRTVSVLDTAYGDFGAPAKMVAMSRDQSFDMDVMSDTDQHREEEQVGLLHATNDDNESISTSLSEDQEKHPAKHQTHKPQWRWTRTLTITILLLTTLVLLIHEALTTRQSHHKTAPTAKLRDEQDYILSPTWSTSTPPTTRSYTFHIAAHQFSPDGVSRPMLLINSTFPGPLIECNAHDELVVRVINDSPNATSIHWHGMFQNGSNWMDGTVGVTNCGIAPGKEFTYRFNVSGQTGTYWYHSHVGMQASDGVVGPLVIHARGDREDGQSNEEKEEGKGQKVPYKQDRVLLVSDHYYTLSSSLLTTYLAPGSENAEPVPPSALINGRNVRDCATLPHRECNSSGLQNARLNLDPEANTRLRIINVGGFAEFALQIDEHEVLVTEVDGTDVLPQSIHRLNILPAQRYSVIVSPPKKQENKGLYWIRARMVTHCFAYEEPELMDEVRAVLDYRHLSSSGTATGTDTHGVGVPESKDWPEIIDVECRDLNTSSLVPVTAIPAPEIDPNHAIYLRSSFQIRDWRLSRGYFNDSSFRVNATEPILQTLLGSGGGLERVAREGFVDEDSITPEHNLVYRTTGTRTITLLIQNFDDGAHPMHLHGYKFFVLGSGHGYPPLSLLEKQTPRSSPQLNLENPLRRDTATVEAFGWLLISFVADNPGVWAFHCHIGWHAEAGLMMAFATGIERVGEVPEEMGKMCKMEGVERGMAPGDDVWVGHREEEEKRLRSLVV